MWFQVIGTYYKHLQPDSVTPALVTRQLTRLYSSDDSSCRTKVAILNALLRLCCCLESDLEAVEEIVKIGKKSWNKEIVQVRCMEISAKWNSMYCQFQPCRYEKWVELLAMQSCELIGCTDLLWASCKSMLINFTQGIGFLSSIPPEWEGVATLSGNPSRSFDSPFHYKLFGILHRAAKKTWPKVWSLHFVTWHQTSVFQHFQIASWNWLSFLHGSWNFVHCIVVVHTCIKSCFREH